MPRPATIFCSRCRVDVPADKIGAPGRCLDPNCPLNNKPTETTA